MPKYLFALAALLMLSACGAPSGGSAIGAPGFDDNGRPKSPYIKLGKPYTIKGRTYFPEHDPNYTEEGMASWYGPGFHGGKTANGEIFNSGDMTAAHRTLPLPSMVRVTNQANGKSVVVRVNDRGPYSDNRIIDLSRAAAQSLDMIRSGVAEVKIEYLPEESTRYAELLATGRTPSSINVTREVIEPSQLAQAETSTMHATRVDSIEIADAAPPATASASKKSTSVWDHLNPVSSAHAKEKAPSLGKETFVKTKRTHHLPPLDSPDDSAPAEISKKAVVTSPYAVLENNKPNARAEENSDVPPPELPIAKERYYLLVGAFSKAENIESIRRKFADDGPLDLAPLNAMGRTLTRVRVGPVDTLQKAEALLAKAHGFAMPDARIITVK